MNKVLIINGHHATFGSPGQLNASMVEKAKAHFEQLGAEVRKTKASGDYVVAEEIEKLVWADLVLLQMPINWMGMPWAMKKYVDEVWMLGMMGQLSDGDGRSEAAPKKNYGLGGKLSGSYMLSVTGNAPKEAFDDPSEAFFAGMSVDDLLSPVHLNFKWLGLEPLPTFMAYDVMKNPDVENDFKRFAAHLEENVRTV